MVSIESAGAGNVLAPADPGAGFETGGMSRGSNAP